MEYFAILADEINRSRQNDLTIASNLATTKAFIDTWKIAHIHQIIRLYCNAIESARKEILISTSFWEGDSLSAHMICSAIKHVVKCKNIPVRIIVDNGNIKNIFKTNRVIDNEGMAALGFHGLNLDDHDILMRSIHLPIFGTIHCKFMVIDREIAILSSNNIQDRPNIELGIQLRGSAVCGFIDMFRKLWYFKNTDTADVKVNHEQIFEVRNDEGDIDILFANRRAYGGFSKDIETPQNRAWWTMMSMARLEIFICSPTFNSDHAIESVLDACCRNTRVTLLVTKWFNDSKESLPFQGGTNAFAIRRLRSQLKSVDKEKFLIVRWYVGSREKVPHVGVHNHVKFLSIDKQICMLGNGNMDTQSWYHSMEVNLIINDERITTEMTDQLMCLSVSH